MSTPLPVVNLAHATYECVFGRGCDGVCCRNGRPPVYPDEAERIGQNLDTFLPHLTPAARRLVRARGFLSRRLKTGLPMLRVVEGWCVFFNRGCVLHKVGAEEGSAFRYKPAACALFPVQRNAEGNWYVRQWGYEDEEWDLFCLDPKHSARPAAESLRDEIALAAFYDESGG